LLNDEKGSMAIEGKTFEEMINNAFKYIENHKNYIVVDGKKYKLVEEN